MGWFRRKWSRRKFRKLMSRKLAEAQLEVTDPRVQDTARWIAEADELVFLTGAGMSTESGVPDFRSPETGLWERYAPDIVANIEFFMKNPLEFWKLAKKIAPALFKAKPNLGHQILAKLEKEGYLKAIITQNIDGLHQKAGNIYVYEVHGNIEELSCMGCRATYGFNTVMRKVKREKQVPPLCDMCGSPLKPNVTFFGEGLPLGPYYESIARAEKADLLIVCGSSLEVAPISNLPGITLKHGGRLVIINEQPTFMDERAHAVFREPLGVVLPLVYEALRDLKAARATTAARDDAEGKGADPGTDERADARVQ